MTAVLVTGAGGYLGGRLVRSLASATGTTTRALVRRPAPWLDTDVVRADLLGREEDLRRACRSIDVVVHLAGANEVAAARDPDTSLSDTIVGTRRIVAAAAAEGAARIVYASTIHVMGPAATTAALDEDARPAPVHPYAVARLASEHLVAASGLDPVVLRITNSVGAPVDPRIERWSLLVNDLCRQAATTGRIRLLTHGMQWRDFVHQDDVCHVIRAALSPSAVPAGTYNVGTGRSRTVRWAAERVQDAFEELGCARPPLEAPPRPDAAPHHADVPVGRLAGLGLAPRGDVTAAIGETARFALEHRAALACGAAT